MPLRHEVDPSPRAEVAAARDPEDERAACGGLQAGDELARVPCGAAHVVRTSDDERRRVDASGANVVVRGVRAQDGSISVAGAPYSRRPVAPYGLR